MGTISSLKSSENIRGGREMELINNTTKTLKDDLPVEIKPGSKLSIAAACFSIYAFQELKTQLSSIHELRFIFTQKLFNEMSTGKAKYHDVDSYQRLLNIMNAI